MCYSESTRYTCKHSLTDTTSIRPCTPGRAGIETTCPNYTPKITESLEECHWCTEVDQSLQAELKRARNKKRLELGLKPGDVPEDWMRDILWPAPKFEDKEVEKGECISQLPEHRFGEVVEGQPRVILPMVYEEPSAGRFDEIPSGVRGFFYFWYGPLAGRFTCC
ncbi:hypothetical protein HYFRA_00013676 [Hymenoscyphus fraxineus]|uniref:Uncharacterized protein n=1 Tax=Hymenoscyphus fraxineus TaxID=746836 RepID=A0A9N9LB93_9HELO|nr:hypothetical protein HYFRA_00013676 [Hymenoscyphus fraxineus]